MCSLLKAAIFIVSISSLCFAQEPVPVLKAGWQRTTIAAPKRDVSPTVPAKPIIAENKYFQRKAREQRTDNPMDPYEASIEGRSAAMEKSVQESRTPQPDDAKGYSYTADVRNDTGKTVAIIFWEYQFVEIARPANSVRRQFLCGVKLKHGDTQQLSAFSLLGPSDVIDAESLAKTTDKLFEEKVQINRIEFSDGAILQRHGWKYSDVKKAVERATSTPWGGETCRAL
ncbi:MAG TPA: hypothetical protein VFZ23_10440 [Pyrinomonadaceae bacterium]